MEKEPEKAKKICLFGGTFDPIHLGHTHIAGAAVKQLGLDKVIFLPCQQSPHKTGQRHASAHHRLAMCQLAIKGLSWAEVSDLDLLSPPPSYSWRTAETISAQYSNSRLFWLMGTDQWQALPRWSHPERLAKLVEFIVFTRGKAPEPREGYRMHAIQGDHPASATAIRKLPASHRSTSWLHPDVASYLESHKLYQNK